MWIIPDPGFSNGFKGARLLQAAIKSDRRAAEFDRMLQERVVAGERDAPVWEGIKKEVPQKTEQQQAEREPPTCCVCMDGANTVLLPCKHMVMCEGCWDIARKRNVSTCPVCRRGVAQAMRVFT